MPIAFNGLTPDDTGCRTCPPSPAVPSTPCVVPQLSEVRVVFGVVADQNGTPTNCGISGNPQCVAPCTGADTFNLVAGTSYVLRVVFDAPVDDGVCPIQLLTCGAPDCVNCSGPLVPAPTITRASDRSFDVGFGVPPFVPPGSFLSVSVNCDTPCGQSTGCCPLRVIQLN